MNKKEFPIETLSKTFSLAASEKTKNQIKNSTPKARRLGDVDFDELKTLTDRYNPKGRHVGELDVKEAIRAQTLLKIIDDAAQSQTLPYPCLPEMIYDLNDSLEAVNIFHGDNADPSKANEWLENNRDSLTVEKIASLIQVSMLIAISLSASEGQKKAVEARRKDPNNKKNSIEKMAEKIRTEHPHWSKNKIADAIIDERPDLKYGTVRKYLTSPSKK